MLVFEIFLAKTEEVYWNLGFLAEVSMVSNLQIVFEEGDWNYNVGVVLVYIKVSHYLLKSYSISMAFDKQNEQNFD